MYIKKYVDMVNHIQMKYPNGEEITKFIRDNSFYSWAIEVVSEDCPESLADWEAHNYCVLLSLDEEDEAILYEWLYSYYKGVSYV